LHVFEFKISQGLITKSQSEEGTQQNTFGIWVNYRSHAPQHLNEPEQSEGYIHGQMYHNFIANREVTLVAKMDREERMSQTKWAR